jgi:hypothetical protein
MPRPKKVGSTREAEQYDTLYWCGLIKAQSGLSDAQIEVKLDLVVDPTGRSFNRWLTGKRAMSHDDIQKVVRRARKVGLLRTRKSLGTHLESALEQRASAGEQIQERASGHLAEAMKAVRDLHAAKRSLNEAAAHLQACIKQAESRGLDVMQLSEGELRGTDVRSLARQVDDLAAGYFLHGKLHSL